MTATQAITADHSIVDAEFTVLDRIDKPGVYPGISREDYVAIPAINQSVLRHFRRTPAHAKAEMDSPRAESDSMRLGNLIHAAILEPDRFSSRYAVMPDLTDNIYTKAGVLAKNPKATDEYAARVSKWGQENIGKVRIDAAELDIVRSIQESIAASQVATELLTGAGQNELAVVWRDGDTGLLCKALVDRLTSYCTIDYAMGTRVRVVVDLKTTDDAQPAFWGKHCHDYGYALQAPFYRYGLKANGIDVHRFLHVVVETTTPYCVAVRELDDESQQQGAIELRRYLDLYAECQASGRWPGYEDSVMMTRLPGYAFKEQ